MILQFNKTKDGEATQKCEKVMDQLDRFIQDFETLRGRPPTRIILSREALEDLFNEHYLASDSAESWTYRHIKVVSYAKCVRLSSDLRIFAPGITPCFKPATNLDLFELINATSTRGLKK